MEIEKRLKAARVNAGLTQEQVAGKIMVSRQTISNWENGKSLPDIVSIINLSDLYQISLFCFLQSQSYIPSAFLWAAHSMISVRARYSG